jgi:2',3'-cyclic-nucleotide 2'-phosphodiesterase (5'-nucleotidase family)
LLIFVLTSIASAGPQQSLPQSSSPDSFVEALGPDDGAAFAILFGGNIRGVLDLCDCNNPRGGLARHVGYVEGFKKHFPKTPVLQVESGNFFTEATDFKGQMPPAAILQNEQVIRALSRWKFDAINLARPDVNYASRLFGTDGITQRLASIPAIKNIISANTVLDDTPLRPAPYIVKELRGPRIKGKLRVGFVGLAEPLRMSEGSDARVSDPLLAAHRVVAEARAKCDLLVLVAHVEHETALRLAEQNPAAGLIIAGDCGGLFQPRTVGKSLVVCAAPGNTHEGDVRAYISKSGEFSLKFRAIELNASVPADPDALAYVEKAREELARLKSSGAH